MSHLEDDLAFMPDKFSGRARLFPLPNLVMFPHVIQPLHIFEPRYVDLLHDAIEGDRLIAMALLGARLGQRLRRPSADRAGGLPGPRAHLASPGREPLQHAAVGPAARAHRARVAAGAVRFARRKSSSATTIIRWPPRPRAPPCSGKLVAAFRGACCRGSKDAGELFNQLSVNSISLGALTDVISYALDIDVRDKANAAGRAERRPSRRHAAGAS